VNGVVKKQTWRLPMNRRRQFLLGVIGSGGLTVCCWLLFRHYGFDVKHSGESFSLGDLQVMVNYGYSEDGDRLRYMVIRAFPSTSTFEERLADSRMDNSGYLPLIRHPDGTMRRVKTDGRVYLYIDDELRTMRVQMSEHDDTIGLAKAGTLEAMWDYLQQFRIASAD
jgi:hypothetical protein